MRYKNAEKENTPNNSKKVIIIVSIFLALVVAVVCIWFFFFKDSSKKNESAIFVTSVAEITGTNLTVSSRYSGVVAPQKTISINKDESKTVSEILVVEGQSVAAGDPLFSYDIEEMQLTLEQSKLTVESSVNTISEYEKQIKELKKERDAASSDNKLSYTIKIQTLELNIKEQQYQNSLKNKEIEKLAASIENNVVTAPESGIIKTINKNNSSDPYGNASAFISVLSSGDYRIKASITELQRYQVSEGQPVLVRSRINPDITWNGIIEKIDFENAEDNNNNSNGGMVYYGGGSGNNGTGSSKYSFYVALNDQSAIATSTEGLNTFDQTKLIIGQHVYIEPDNGVETKTGLWLPSFYMVEENANFYIWVRDKKDKLEKRKIETSDYDPETDTYKIDSGLESTDYIAYPEESLKNGMPTTEQFDFNNIDNGFVDGGFIDGGLIDDGFIDDGFIMEGDSEQFTPDEKPSIDNFKSDENFLENESIEEIPVSNPEVS